VHSNPVLITFCSILYYDELNEKIYKQRLKKIEFINLNNQNEIVLIENNMLSLSYTKNLQKRVSFNRWHLYLRLWLNKELIQYRKHNLIAKRLRNFKESNN
jgi:hypothetical protein